MICGVNFMATNPYFNNFNEANEQMLIDDLVVESIQQRGMDVTYITRSLDSVDNVMNEDDTSNFDHAFDIEMYIKTVDNFEGEDDFLSKFGLQVRDSMTLTVSLTRFEQMSTETRPKEGDLIFFPLNNKVFEIQHVEHEPVFYQMGTLQMYDLRVELFEYSGEHFNTGITEIDTLFNEHDITSNTAFNDIDSVDPFADNSEIERAADDVLDFSENNPFSELPDF